jgi:hypothetical protein
MVIETTSRVDRDDPPQVAEDTAAVGASPDPPATKAVDDTTLPTDAPTASEHPVTPRAPTIEPVVEGPIDEPALGGPETPSVDVVHDQEETKEASRIYPDLMETGWGMVGKGYHADSTQESEGEEMNRIHDLLNETDDEFSEDLDDEHGDDTGSHGLGIL